MTIYRDGVEQEKVHLHKLTNKAEMHALFREKGFVQKTEAEKATESKEGEGVNERRKVREEQRRERELLGKGGLPSYLTMFGLYMTGAVILLGVVTRRGRRRSR